VRRRGTVRAKAQHRKPTRLKRGNAPTARRGSSSQLADLQEQLKGQARELEEARDERAALAVVLRVISSSPNDTQPVFETILRHVPRLCQAPFCWIFRYDGQLIHFVAAHGLSQEVAEVFRSAYPMPPGRASAAARAILDGVVAEVPDIPADPEYQHSHLAAMMNFRSVVAVPMLKDGSSLGAIIMARPQVGRFPEPQIRLLCNFADQAVIAIENTRLFNELRESLQQQTATADVLKVISRSMYPSSYRLMPTMPMEPARGSVTGRVLLERKSVQIIDVVADPEYTLIEIQKRVGFRTLLGVPLLRQATPIGVLHLYRTVVRPFTNKQIELVETFADQAVIAIENVRLLNELRESLQKQTATSEVLGVISRSSGDLAPVFETILANATRICEAKFGSMYLNEGGAVRIVAMHNAPPSFAEERRRNPLIPPDTTLGRILATKQTVQIADLQNGPAHINAPSGTTGAQLAKLAGARTVVVVPMLKESELVGVIIIYRQEVRPFTDGQIELVKSFASQAVIAIENTRLLHELRQRTADLREAHDQVLAQAADLATWNRTLEQRVAEQVAEIERVGRLKSFLPPQIAQLVVSAGHESVLESHRRDVSVVFCDLRGFTAFSELAEPEEVMLVLREYQTKLGVLINKFEGTVERFSGDGLLVVFNDPLPCPDASMRAVQMALEMRDEVAKLSVKWSHSGHDIGFGVGIAHGYATLGSIGYEGRLQYSVTGKVANLASRLCDQAKDGQILVDINVFSAVETLADVEFAGELALKGFSRPVKAFNVCNLRSPQS
jgi:class 3 adenylate cyclase/putative methionine-R-sulfoxide reductase with GAF domain